MEATSGHAGRPSWSLGPLGSNPSGPARPVGLSVAGEIGTLTFPMHTPPKLLLPVLAVLALSLVSPIGAAAKEPTDSDPAIATKAPPVRTPPGYDISYPQCGGPFPSPFSFAIVGVNGGRVYSPNPCLGAGNGPSELAWAGRDAQLYANTGNPGPELSSYWPIGQTTPRECGTAANPDLDTIDCAYDYGWNAAADSYRIAVEAYISLGWAEPGATRTPVANAWWLDVETANSWRDDPALNVAALQGAVDYLESVGAASVGFYSAPNMWNAITGGTDAFAAYPSWHAGARTLRGAKANCGDPSLTGGDLVMTQYFDKGFDANYLCP